MAPVYFDNLRGQNRFYHSESVIYQSESWVALDSWLIHVSQATESTEWSETQLVRWESGLKATVLPSLDSEGTA